MDFKIGEPVWWMQNGVRVDGRVVRSLGGGKYEVKKNIGGTWEVDGADLHHVFDNYPANSRACNAVRSTNAVVRKALNACARNGYVVLRTASGETAKVYEGDRVSYAGKEYVAKALGSPQMDKATLVDGSGNKLIVRLKDVDLKALNTRTARNATFGSAEDAERYSEQAVKAAKSRVFSEMGTLKDVVRALRGYPNSKTVQKNLVTLEWALEEIKKAAQTLS